MPNDPQDRLFAALGAIDGQIAVAVSGGIDSLTLSTVAHRAAPERVVMFHAVSAAVPAMRRLASNGWRRCRAGGWRWSTPASSTTRPTWPIRSNRCYFCKTDLYGAIAKRTDAQIVSGANLDDLGEYRPGLDAARNRGVRHPFLEAEIDKATVRALAREVASASFPSCPRRRVSPAGSRPASRSAPPL